MSHAPFLKLVKPFIAVGLFLVVGMAVPVFAGQSSYLNYLVGLSLILTVLTVSLNIAMGFTGLISVAHGAFFGLGAYTTVLLQTRLSLPFWLAILGGAAMAASFGLLLGVLTLRLSGHYFAISSLAFALVLVIVLRRWTSVTNGQAGLQGIPGPSDIVVGPVVVSLGSGVGLYVCALILCIGSLLLTYWLRSSRFGRALEAVRANQLLAASLGINVVRAKLAALAGSAALAAIAGAWYAIYIGFFQPQDAGFMRGFEAIVYLVVGGPATVWGPVIGTFVVVLLPEYLRAISDYRFLLMGLVLILIVQRAPGGLVAIMSRGGAWARRVLGPRVKPVSARAAVTGGRSRPRNGLPPSRGGREVARSNGAGPNTERPSEGGDPS